MLFRSVAGFRLAPWLYDRLAPTMVDKIVLRGPVMTAGPGNVLDATPDVEGLRGGWTAMGRLRARRSGRARWRR